MCKQSELGCHAPTPVTLKALSHQMRRKKPEWIVLSHPKRNETGCYCSGRTGKWSSFSWLKRERLNASTAPSAGSSHVQQEHGCLNIYCSFYPLEWFLNLCFDLYFYFIRMVQHLWLLWNLLCEHRAHVGMIRKS